MVSYFQDIITLLLNPPGNLVFHLVLSFSLAGSLAIALNYWRETGETQGKRLVIGLSLLLLLRLALFVSAGLAWQGVINGVILLPPLDRAVSLMSVVLIVWMWVFPQPTRVGDAASLLLALFVAALFVFSLVWWSAQITQSEFIGSWPDLATVMASLAITTSGGLLLALKRPAGWGYGLGMLFILLIGDVAYLTYPDTEGDFSGAIRLAQMVAYPMLLLLPLRFTRPSKAAQLELEPSATIPVTDIAEKKQTDHYQLLFSLVNEPDPQNLYRSIVKLVAHEWLADLCLLVAPPGLHGRIDILYGYDLIQEKMLGTSIINSQSIPVLASALRRGRPLRLPASSTSPDLAGLGKLLEIKSIGHLLAVPVLDEKDSLLAGLVLMTPYSKRSWTADDQFRLTEFSKPLAQVLHHHQMLASTNKDVDQIRAQLRIAQGEAEKYRKENERLIAQMGINLDDAGDHQVHAASLAALLAAHEAAQEKIEKLQAENARLQGYEEQQPDEYLTVSEGEYLQSSSYPEAHAEAELRLALEEVAYLKSLIYESDRKLLELKEETAEHSPNTKQVQEITSLVQELRQPMSSIVGYTDFLLEESIGILGTMQRRFLERIRSSAERLADMVNNLILIAGAANASSDNNAGDILIPDLIDEAISHTSDVMRKKNIALRMDLPKNIPTVNASKTSLQRLMEIMLDNASQASPSNGEITLRVRLEGEDGAKDFVLIQVADQGIAAQSIPELNTSTPSDKTTPHTELDESRKKLTLMRTLAESLGGRIWVDADPGVGSIFSLLFPIAPLQYNSGNGSRGFG